MPIKFLVLGSGGGFLGLGGGGVPILFYRRAAIFLILRVGNALLYAHARAALTSV